MAWAYSDIVKDHFKNPRNILEDESSFNEDGKGLVGSPACGDMMEVFIKVKDDKIVDFKWKTYGCASALASTSMLSEMVVENGGMSLKEAFSITPSKIMERLGGLPNNKIHCSVLGDQALQAAINDYYRRSGQEDKIIEKKAKVICNCLNVTDEDIEEAVLEGADTFDKLQDRTKVATACGKCKDDVIGLMEDLKRKYFCKV